MINKENQEDKHALVTSKDIKDNNNKESKDFEKHNVRDTGDKEKLFLFKYSKDRKFITNLILCLVSFSGLIVLPYIFYFIFHAFIKDEYLCNIVADICLIVVLYLMYFKDLNKEFKTYIKNFKENISKSFKYYIIGFIGRVFFNLLIMFLLKNISSNESQVREMLYSNTLFAIISISIIAPISEELIFRKSIQPIIKNKWIYVLVCGLLFGGAHILTNIINNVFVITDLIYILPYASLGCSFALMDYETNTTFCSIVMHFLHNTCTAILLLITYTGGNL